MAGFELDSKFWGRREFSLTGLMRFSRAQIIGALAVLLLIWLVVVLRLLSSHA
jgi:hypothetical protein